jgi:hypothetical protein
MPVYLIINQSTQPLEEVKIADQNYTPLFAIK